MKLGLEKKHFFKYSSLPFMIVACLVIFRLIWLHVYEHEFLFRYGDQQRSIRVKTSSCRGIIYDRHGAVIACNDRRPSLFITPLDQSFSLTQATLLYDKFPHINRALNREKISPFIWLERSLSTKRYQELQELPKQLVHTLHEPVRYYAEQSFGSVVGNTNIDMHGISGIELLQEPLLRGDVTSMLIERDARCGKFAIEYDNCLTLRDGNKITLSLDTALQWGVCQELEKTVTQYQAELGSALIMDPVTGEILAMADYPYAQDQTSTHLLVRSNNCITQCYELGSVFKVFAALAALADNVVDPDEIIKCDGKVSSVRGFRVENWKPLYDQTFKEVVEHSSNVGIAKVVDRLGPRLFDHYDRLGFGKRTGLNFPGQRHGFVNPPARWSKSSPYVLSFGYEVMASLLQLACAFSIVANGGYEVCPTFFKQEDLGNKCERKRLYESREIMVLQEILERIGSRYTVPGARVIGKTGTARCVEQGQYSKKRHIYTFVGAVQAGDYQRVIVTFIKHPAQAYLWASQVTGPLFQRIARRMFIHDQVLAYQEPDIKAFS